MDIDQHILQRRHLYFGEYTPSAEIISKQIAFTANTLGATEVLIYNKNRWTLIKSDFDWLYAAKFPNKGEGSIWERPWAFPEAAQNATRFEVMVRVFSERAFSTDGKYLEVIKGNRPTEHELSDLGLSDFHGGRCVAFIFKIR